MWRCLLNDPNVSRNGRRGQRQNGVDIYGIRNSDPDHVVGIQCKLKSDGHCLTEKEIRGELKNALTFEPDLREYFIITTAPDDVALQELARKLSADQTKRGRHLLVYVWGWNTLEEKIANYAEALKAFDPTYGAFGGQLLEKMDGGMAHIEAMEARLTAKIMDVPAQFVSFNKGINVPPGDATVARDSFEAHLDVQIDSFRQIANDGKPRTAHSLLTSLFDQVEATASGRILFRIKANIGNCHLALGENDQAAALFTEAYEHAPTEPKAIANKALSLLLQGEWKSIQAFADEELRADPTNDALAGYFVQASRFDDTVEEPLDLLPDPVKQSAPVTIARVAFLRHRGRSAEWWQAARDARDAHPDDDFAKQLAAEADVDEITGTTRFQRTARLVDDERDKITAAAAVLLELWNKAQRGEEGAQPEAVILCSNLTVAYRALEDLPKALDIAQQGLAVAPENAELVIRATAVAIDAGDMELAHRLLPQLSEGPSAAILQFQFFVEREDWPAVIELCRTSADQFSEAERLMMTTTGRLAEIKLSPGEDTAALLSTVVRDAADNARASIVSAEFARMLGQEELADEAYRNALLLIDADSHIAERVMTAFHAVKRNDWRNVVDMLNDHVAMEVDSTELKILARAFVNDTPVRRSGVLFFDKLPAAISNLPFYQTAAGLLHFNRGDLKQAEKYLRGAVALNPDLTSYLVLFSTLRRSNQEDMIAPILETLDTNQVMGTEVEKISLAHELRAVGQEARAFELAYRVLMRAGNDPNVALKYFGLIMSDTSSDLLTSAHGVAVDMWVRLEGSNGEQNEFVIEEGESRPTEGVINPAHPTATAVIGLEVGASFDQPVPVGDSITWRVIEIKHKYIHALHDVMENFQVRFPNAEGLYRLSANEGDVQSVLDHLKEVAETNREVADFYLVQQFPMAVVASQFGGDIVGFADYIRLLDASIETCAGTRPERLAARATINQHRAAGAVLDTYTAWTAASMDVFDILIAVFGTLVVPRSTLDDLQTLKEVGKFRAGESITIAWHNGQFIKQEYSKADIEARSRYIDEQIAKIELNCTVLPSSAPDSPTQLATAVTTNFGPHVLDAANLTAEGYILVSEDLYFRQMANAAVSAKGVWLQVVLTYALDKKLMTRSRFAEAVVQLAARKHGHVSLDANTLWDVFAADNTSKLERFRAIAEFIGSKKADLRSHISVVIEFFALLWRGGLTAEIKGMKATGILLENLIRHCGEHWPHILNYLRTKANRPLQGYINQWMIGHFLPKEPPTS